METACYLSRLFYYYILLKMKMTRDKLYFIALLPPAGIRNEITAIKEYFRDHYEANHALKSPPHITLFPPFKWPESNEEEIIYSLDRLASVLRPFPLVLNGFGSFPTRVIFIRVEKNEILEKLYQTMKQHLKSGHGVADERDSGRPYHPHLTLAHKDLTKKAYEPSWREFGRKNIRYEFPVNSISLLKHDGKKWNIHHESLMNN